MHVRCQVGGCGGLRRKSLGYSGLSDCCVCRSAVRAPGHSRHLGSDTRYWELLGLALDAEFFHS